jgi:phosphotransferase system HPr-like phosphotransfer protein/mannitol/fructose-specific phosphotransferase system IIA component (Ntr-type)
MHLRPAGFLEKLCRCFPQTEFRIRRKEEAAGSAVNLGSMVSVVIAYFADGDEVVVDVTGKCEILASEFVKVALEHLDGYSDDTPAAIARLTGLIDEVFARTEDPDIGADQEAALIGSVTTESTPADECRAVAAINDRLHNLSLPMLPLIARHFGVALEIRFEIPDQGIFCFRMDEENQYELKDAILNLQVEIGTRITVLTRGPNRIAANKAVTNVLAHLWQCDDWIRRQSRDFTGDQMIAELLAFAEEVERTKSQEYTSVSSPYISNLLPIQHVFLNDKAANYSKDAVLSQLASAHARSHGLLLSAVLDRVNEAEKREPVVLRPGFSLAHGAMDRTPRISISFGVYPRGVIWDGQNRIVHLVCMVIFAKDTYGTWRDCLAKLGILFHAYPGLQSQLIQAQSTDEFRTALRTAETAMRR